MRKKKNKIKKPFKDTIIGKIVAKAGDIIKDVPTIITQAVSGNYAGAIATLIDNLTESDDPKAKQLLKELELKRMAIEKEMAEIELKERELIIQDLNSARTREVELAKAGYNDWLQKVVGIIALLILMFVAYVIVFITIPATNRELFIHFIGVAEGISLPIFAYYFGSSKGSSDKNRLIGK